jgi:curli biogenesis system outer membrane secretion channel CsgG
MEREVFPWGCVVTNRTSNAYRRMTGRLRVNERSALLETVDDKLIYLTASDDLAQFDGCDVVVEGDLTGVDRLSLTWVGFANP